MKPVVILVLLAAAAPCAAAPLQPWIGASGSYNTYAMDDVNDDIAAFNRTFAPMSVDEIDSGIGFGVSVGADVDRWSFSIGYDRLPASTGPDGGSGGPSYDLAANTFLGRAAYRLPLQTKFGLAVGLGVGIAAASGDVGQPTVLTARTGPGIQAVIYEGDLSVSGTTFCFEGFVQGDVPLGGKFSLVPSVGYRAAKIDGEIRVDGGSGTQTYDFSGMAANLGLRFAL